MARVCLIFSVTAGKGSIARLQHCIVHRRWGWPTCFFLLIHSQPFIIASRSHRLLLYFPPLITYVRFIFCTRILYKSRLALSRRHLVLQSKCFTVQCNFLHEYVHMCMTCTKFVYVIMCNLFFASLLNEHEIDKLQGIALPSRSFIRGAV